MLSRTLSPSVIRKKPAHCSNAFAPSFGTFKSSFFVLNLPFSSRYVIMFFETVLLIPATYAKAVTERRC